MGHCSQAAAYTSKKQGQRGKGGLLGVGWEEFGVGGRSREGVFGGWGGVWGGLRGKGEMVHGHLEGLMLLVPVAMMAAVAMAVVMAAEPASKRVPLERRRQPVPTDRQNLMAQSCKDMAVACRIRSSYECCKR